MSINSNEESHDNFDKSTSKNPSSAILSNILQLSSSSQISTYSTGITSNPELKIPINEFDSQSNSQHPTFDVSNEQNVLNSQSTLRLDPKLDPKLEESKLIPQSSPSSSSENRNHFENKEMNPSDLNFHETGEINENTLFNSTDVSSLKQTISNQKLEKLSQQMEYYFSNGNLFRDSNLRDLILKSPNEWIGVDIFLPWHRIAMLTQNPDDILISLKNSKSLAIDMKNRAIKRIEPIPLTSLGSSTTLFCSGIPITSTWIVVKNFLESHSIQILSVNFRRSKLNEFKGSCWIQVANMEDVNKCLKLSGKISIPDSAENLSFQTQKVYYGKRSDNGRSQGALRYRDFARCLAARKGQLVQLTHLNKITRKELLDICLKTGNIIDIELSKNGQSASVQFLDKESTNNFVSKYNQEPLSETQHPFVFAVHRHKIRPWKKHRSSKIRSQRSFKSQSHQRGQNSEHEQYGEYRQNSEHGQYGEHRQTREHREHREHRHNGHHGKYPQKYFHKHNHFGNSKNSRNSRNHHHPSHQQYNNHKYNQHDDYYIHQPTTSQTEHQHYTSHSFPKSKFSQKVHHRQKDSYYSPHKSKFRNIAQEKHPPINYYNDYDDNVKDQSFEPSLNQPHSYYSSNNVSYIDNEHFSYPETSLYDHSYEQNQSHFEYTQDHVDNFQENNYNLDDTQSFPQIEYQTSNQNVQFQSVRKTRPRSHHHQYSSSPRTRHHPNNSLNQYETANPSFTPFQNHKRSNSKLSISSKSTLLKSSNSFIKNYEYDPLQEE